MMQVVLTINGKPIDTISVTNEGYIAGEGDNCLYDVTHKKNKWSITHKRSDGALPLAKKAIDCVVKADG